MPIQSGYVLELAVTKIAFDRLDIVWATSGSGRSTTRYARRPARAPAAAAFLTSLLELPSFTITLKKNLLTRVTL